MELERELVVTKSQDGGWKEMGRGSDVRGKLDPMMVRLLYPLHYWCGYSRCCILKLEHATTGRNSVHGR